MRAMTLRKPQTALVEEERPDPRPGAGELRLRVLACGVCRTDLHIVDGELPSHRMPIVPGHEVVGFVDAIGDGVRGVEIGHRMGLPWSAAPAAPAATAPASMKTCATRRPSRAMTGTAASPPT